MLKKLITKLRGLTLHYTQAPVENSQFSEECGT